MPHPEPVPLDPADAPDIRQRFGQEIAALAGFEDRPLSPPSPGSR